MYHIFSPVSVVLGACVTMDSSMDLEDLDLDFDNGYVERIKDILSDLNETEVEDLTLTRRRSRYSDSDNTKVEDLRI